MISVRKPGMYRYVDRSTQQWVVLDAEGDFWILPDAENPWGHRRPFYPNDETNLEPVPGHYKIMLRIPS
jgi:hypothetical protein